MNLTVNSIIRRQNSPFIGLIGGFFRFDGGKDTYGISCNHVLADYKNCATGDAITDENGKPVGTLSHWLLLEEGFVNAAEFALFRVLPEYTPVWNSADATWKPTGYAKPQLNAEVRFTKGKGTESQGRISDVSHPVKISSPTATYHIENCIQVDAMNNTVFSVSGDSGGAVYAGNELLGIILGIAHGGKKTFVVPFEGAILRFAGLNIML